MFLIFICLYTYPSCFYSHRGMISNTRTPTAKIGLFLCIVFSVPGPAVSFSLAGRVRFAEDVSLPGTIQYAQVCLVSAVTVLLICLYAYSYPKDQKVIVGLLLKCKLS